MNLVEYSFENVIARRFISIYTRRYHKDESPIVHLFFVAIITLISRLPALYNRARRAAAFLDTGWRLVIPPDELLSRAEMPARPPASLSVPLTTLNLRLVATARQLRVGLTVNNCSEVISPVAGERPSFWTKVTFNFNDILLSTSRVRPRIRHAIMQCFFTNENRKVHFGR